MVSQQTILVGVDGSHASMNAVEWAVGRAVCTGQAIRIVCVYSMAAYTSYGFESSLATLDPEVLERGAQGVVDDAISHARTCPGSEELTIEGEAITGDPASVLVSLSEEVDLIVIGTESRSTLLSRIFGTVSSSVPAYSRCPVVVVPVHEGGKDYVPVERVVVGVEASEKVSKALRMAVDEANIWNAQLTVVSAVPIPGVGGVMTWIPSAVDHDMLMKEMKRSLDIAVDTAIEGKELKVRRHVIDGAPAQLLVEFSTAVDLVVVGSRGYSALTQAVLGVTSQAVLANASCPVMVVPHHNERVATVSYGWGRL